VRGGHAGVSADVEKQGMASEGKSGHQEGGPSDAWRGRAGGGGGALHGGGRGMHYISGRTEQGSRRAQRKEMRGETVKDSSVKNKRSKGLKVQKLKVCSLTR
jgi:hypothetical protein